MSKNIPARNTLATKNTDALRNLAMECGESLITPEFLALLQAQKPPIVEETELTGDTDTPSE